VNKSVLNWTQVCPLHCKTQLPKKAFVLAECIQNNATSLGFFASSKKLKQPSKSSRKGKN
jgi:hypothetical protein